MPSPSEFQRAYEEGEYADPIPREPTYEALVGPRIEHVIHTDQGEEHRVVDESTGGEKGAKLAELGALDPQALLEVARVAGFGGRKYARLNFMKGFRYSLSFDAMQRHLLLFWAGEDRDEESGLHHLAHAAWHCLALLAFQIYGLGTDDRYRKDTP